MPMPTDTFWGALTVLIVVVGKILDYYWQRLLKHKLNRVVEQTDGINNALRATVKKQDAERIATAKVVEKDKKTALRKKEK